MKLLLQAGIHLIKKVITFVIYGRSVQVFKACTLFYFFPAEFFFSQIFLREKGFVPQISQIYTDILHHDFSSSDFTDESEGILAYRITHGISQNFGRWPMARALYMLLLFFVTQISQMTQIFSSDNTEFIRRFPAEAITHGFSRRRPVRSVQIPPGIGICPTKKNLCISVKSVGQNNPHKEKSASSAKSA